MLFLFQVMAAVRAALTFVEKAIKSHNVVVFSKTTCPFSILAKRILTEAGVQEMQVYEIEQRDDGQEIQVRISLSIRPSPRPKSLTLRLGKNCNKYAAYIQP